MILRPQGVDEQRTRITRTSLEKTSSRCRQLGQSALVQQSVRHVGSFGSCRQLHQREAQLFQQSIEADSSDPLAVPVPSSSSITGAADRVMECPRLASFADALHTPC